MKKIIVLSAVLIALSCNKEKSIELFKSKNKVGIGLVHMNLNENILLYKTAKDSISYDVLKCKKIFFGSNSGMYEFKTNKLKGKLNPYIMYEGDSDIEAKGYEHILTRFRPRLAFKVIEKKSNGFVVIINEKTLETSFIKIDFKNDLGLNLKDNPNFDPNFVDSKIDNWFYYESWEQALKRAYAIQYDSKNVYNKPNGVKIKSKIEFNIIDSINGDWARLIVRNDRFNPNFGWIKWKENDSIRVAIIDGVYE